VPVAIFTRPNIIAAAAMYIRKNPVSLTCGLDLAAQVLHGKWKMRLLWFIAEGAVRPSALHRKIPDASRRVLNMQLKELEEHGFVHKVIFAQMPPKVEYGLTELGRTAIPVIGALGEWADAHQAQLRTVISKSVMNTEPF